ncbi:MAG: isoprenoid biosynthesis protein ElbB [Bacteroidetes bacterium HGW-Bacteroidetes-4]|jgi:enhancing lycopene biosynthesis protein 2|nr:MAG: isoprenoid biosynthesis protein ElbB [Bacteroidetes bacterium HGW-Bacteroidetes-4]
MKTVKKFALVLSGCGVYDGAEIHEATLSMLAIDKAKCTYQCFAPDMEQYHVINHLNGEAMNEKRNVLVESARIARGNIKPLSQYKAHDFDGIIFPGGFGAAKNLSNLAFKGADCSIIEEVEQAIMSTYLAGKPIGALCIAPAIMAKVFQGASVTIGNDLSTIETIEKMGSIHEQKSYGEVAIDKQYKLVTTPCYMLKSSISQIEAGATRVVQSMLELM